MFELSSDSQGREMPGAGLFHLIARRQDGELLFPLDGDRHHFWEAIGEHSVDFVGGREINGAVLADQARPGGFGFNYPARRRAAAGGSVSSIAGR